VSVNRDLSFPGHPDVFVLGDMASVQQDNGKPVPGVAPAAMQMGEFAAATIAGDLRGEQRKTFQYFNKGNLATIGRSAAVADVRGLKLKGFIAWITWLFVHILFLIGFRSRVSVVWEWFWSYVTFQRGARLITGISRTIVPPPGVSVGTSTPVDSWSNPAPETVLSATEQPIVVSSGIASIGEDQKNR
jgi:NADH dehydrogenase